MRPCSQASCLRISGIPGSKSWEAKSSKLMCGAPIWSRFDAKHLKGTLGWLLVSNWCETWEFALYELVIARGGPKLAPAVARLPSTKLDPADPDSRDTHSLSGTKFRRSCESLLVWN